MEFVKIFWYTSKFSSNIKFFLQISLERQILWRYHSQKSLNLCTGWPQKMSHRDFELKSVLGITILIFHVCFAMRILSLFHLDTLIIPNDEASKKLQKCKKQCMGAQFSHLKVCCDQRSVDTKGNTLFVFVFDKRGKVKLFPRSCDIVLGHPVVSFQIFILPTDVECV